MGYTCFDNGDSQYENPCIAVSNDNVNWTVPEGRVNPIEPKPEGSVYLADVCLFMSPDNKIMYMLFKYAGGSTRIIYLRSSTDGVNWSPKVALITNNYEDVSPTVVWDGTQYLMWTVKHDDNPNTIYLRTAHNAEGPWSEPVACNILTGHEPWHIEVCKIGNQYHMLMQGVDSHNQYFGKSNNGIDWELSKKPIIRQFISGKLNGNFYKGSMVPMITNNGLEYGYWYGTRNPYYICYSKITFNRSKLLSDFNNNVLQASIGMYPWVFCDTFNRADSTSGLGISDSGHIWTKVLGNELGIDGKRAYLPIVGNSRAITDIGISDFYVGISIPVVGVGGWILFRYKDSSNMWRFGIKSTGEYTIEKIVAGNRTVITSIGMAVAGDNFGVECDGNKIKMFINGKLAHTITDSDVSDGTNIGLNIDNTTVRFKNFIARSIV